MYLGLQRGKKVAFVKQKLDPAFHKIDQYIETNDDYVYDPVVGEYVLNDAEYKQVLKDREKERIGKLEITKRILWLQMKALGLSYEQLMEKINSNPDAQAEWETCGTLQRNNPLLDSMAPEFGITSLDLDNMFRIGNGETPKAEITIKVSPSDATLKVNGEDESVVLVDVDSEVTIEAYKQNYETVNKTIIADKTKTVKIKLEKIEENEQTEDNVKVDSSENKEI